MTTPPDILCLGEASGCLSLVDASRRLHRLDLAGDGLLAALAAARAGGRVGLMAALGRDPIAEVIRRVCLAERIDDSALKIDDNLPTGFGIADAAMPRSRHALTAGIQISPSDLPTALLRRVRVLYLGSALQSRSVRTCDASFEAIRIARSVGVAVAYRAAAEGIGWPLERARAISQAALRASDIALLTLDDGARLSGFSDPDAVCDYHLANGARIVLLSLSPRETLVATSLARQRFTARAGAAADAPLRTAAHDGAFLAEWVRAEDPFEAARYALAAVTLLKGGDDALDCLPSRTAVLAHLARQERGSEAVELGDGP
jgi:2-dehydro-3-deoxygluconokinase